MGPSGWARSAPAIWLVSSLICSTSGPRVARRARTAARRASVLDLVADGVWGFAQPVDQLFGGLAAAVAVAGQERLHALGAQGACVGGAGVALQERERDRRVDVSEQARGAGPERVELGAQPVGQLDAAGDEVFAGAGQDTQRDRLVARGRQRGEAVVVGAGELAEDHRVVAVGLAGIGTEPVAGGLDLVGMDRQHLDPGGEQPADQEPVGALDREPLDLLLQQQVDQLADPLLVMDDRLLAEQCAVLVSDADVMLLAGPVQARHRTHARSSSVEVLTVGAADRGTVAGAHRQALEGQRPVAAWGASHRREARVSRGPSQRQARLALSRRWSSAPSTKQPPSVPGHHPITGKVAL